MHQKVLQLYKPIGSTPLESIGSLRQYLPEYKNSTLGYAGRLDPMAEGLLIILVDDENKRRKLYERYDKKYEFEILFGATTDTYDPLGLVHTFEAIPTDIACKLKSLAPSIAGVREQPYPPYSSARVQGKPLFYWAREKKLEGITIPTKTIEIKHFEITNIRNESFSTIYESMRAKINRVKGDFRQKEILTQWEKVYAKERERNFVVASCVATCTSGTYIRSLSYEIGQKIGIGALALSIKRTQVGPFQLKDALKFI